MPGDMRLGGGKAPKGGRGTHGQECGEEGEVVSGASEADLFAGDSERGRDQKDAKVQIAERTLLKQAQFKFNIMCWLAPFGRWFAQLGLCCRTWRAPSLTKGPGCGFES